MAFTSSSEARALGGLIGQYAVVETDCTSLKVLDVGTNLQLKDSDVFLQAQKKRTTKNGKNLLSFQKQSFKKTNLTFF